ncbi:MAG: hypothetical protein JW912_02440 [Sedimentisphaerales bacterium]|nr:hypothetical protein [Sedimentisphaerales bacterium]
MKKIITGLSGLVVLSVFLITSGCADETKTYIGKPPTCRISGRSVNGNLSWARRMNHQKVLLKQEWLADYILSLQVESGGSYVPLYRADELKPIIPSIQQSLAECGNVRIDGVSNCTMSFSVRKGIMYHGGNVYDGGGGVIGEPKEIPADAYVRHRE